MADYTNSSVDPRSTYPENAIDTQEWSRVEPLLTSELLTRRFLKGIPLVSSQKNPLTNKYDVWDEEDLKDVIFRSVSQVEMDAKIDIFPVKRSEKQAFDRNEMIDLGYMRLNHRPILSVDKLSIAPGNSPDILVIAKEWVSHADFPRGLIRIIPTINTIVSGGYIPANGSVGQGSAFVALMGGLPWIPAFWTVEYTTGFNNGNIPRVLNELIGCYAAIEVLSMLATTNKASSQSLGMDGLSQSTSNAGPQVYDGRIKVLDDRRKQLLGKFKALFGGKFILSNI